MSASNGHVTGPTSMVEGIALIAVLRSLGVLLHLLVIVSDLQEVRGEAEEWRGADGEKGKETSQPRRRTDEVVVQRVQRVVEAARQGEEES